MQSPQRIAQIVDGYQTAALNGHLASIDKTDAEERYAEAQAEEVLETGKAHPTTLEADYVREARCFVHEHHGDSDMLAALVDGTATQDVRDEYWALVKHEIQSGITDRITKGCFRDELGCLIRPSKLYETF